MTVHNRAPMAKTRARASEQSTHRLASLAAVVAATARRVGPRNPILFTGALALYLVASAIVSVRLAPTGDEPSYLLLGDALIRHHTANLAVTTQDHLPIPLEWAHIADYLGNGEQLVYYLPGYSLSIGVFYVLGGRMAVFALQSVVASGAVVLLFREGRRLYASPAAGLFAALAFFVALPPLLFVAQAYPSTLASVATLIGFLLVTRRLPDASGQQQVLYGAGVGAISALLPWLHSKYALEAVVLVILAVFQLRPFLHRPISAHRGPWLAALLVCSMTLTSFLAIAVYCHVQYGTWTPPFASGAHSVIAFTDFSLPRLLTLYADMLVSQQSGLLAWAPLYILALPGCVLLWRRARREATALLACVAGLWGGFLPALFSTQFAQGYALPARFAVESAPFFALCAAAVFSTGLPALQAGLRNGRLQLRSYAARVLPETATVAPIGNRGVRGAQLALAALATCSLVLLLVTAEFGAVGLRNPELLYSSPAGNRLVAKYPHVLPAWWFAWFPDPLHVVASSGRVSLAPSGPASGASSGPALAVLTATVEIPAGTYTATFTLNCSLAPGVTTPATDATPQIQLVVERFAGASHTVLAVWQLSTWQCATGATHVTLPFSSLGYEPTAFHILADSTLVIGIAQVEYAPVRA